MSVPDQMNQAPVQFRREPIVEAESTPHRNPVTPYLEKGGCPTLNCAFDIITHSHSICKTSVIKSTQREALYYPCKRNYRIVHFDERGESF